MDEDIESLINTIKNIKNNGVFNPFIDYIRFPFYRNLEKNTKISFDFPLTVFVGQNGSGKSSTLQALYGCPSGYSVGKFWFSTKVDPIENSGERPAIIYAYTNENGEQLEALKSRIKRDNDPDYWEPSRPLVSYGMKVVEGGGRNPLIQMNVLYLDFRSILSAFDKYFYYFIPEHLKSKTPQDFLRKKSVYLKKVIDTDNLIKCGSKKQNKTPQYISENELKIMSSILNKSYINGKIIEHKLFREWGTSILFTTLNVVYSEAFAGSGEIAVATLVHELMNVKNNSLVLLDEPEISLHPGAQKKLKKFILEQIKIKHLQVVISTHSANLIEGLPPNAVKVFTQLPDGKFHVENERMPEEAFYYIGQNPNTKKKIIVEDKLAQKIIQSVINEIGPETASLFDVEFHAGGASVIKTDFIRVYSQDSESNFFVIFDGDQKITKEHFNVNTIPYGTLTSMDSNLLISLKKLTQKQTGCDIKFHTDGNSNGGNRNQEFTFILNYLKYYYRNVFYLPQLTPEEIIWNCDLASHLLEYNPNKCEIMNRLDTETNFKEKFRILGIEVFVNNKNCIDSAHDLFLKRWLQIKNKDFIEIKEIINNIKHVNTNGTK